MERRLRGVVLGDLSCVTVYRRSGAQGREGIAGRLLETMARRDDETSDDGEAGEERHNRDWLARGYVVFNNEQVDYWEPPQTPMPRAPGADPFAPIPGLRASFEYGAIVRHGGDRAYYTPSADFIRMPERRQFVGSGTSSPAEAYYGTLFHELTHWSGAKSRCDRDLIGALWRRGLRR